MKHLTGPMAEELLNNLKVQRPTRLLPLIEAVETLKVGDSLLIEDTDLEAAGYKQSASLGATLRKRVLDRGKAAARPRHLPNGQGWLIQRTT